jgi:hypothetical protein
MGVNRVAVTMYTAYCFGEPRACGELHPLPTGPGAGGASNAMLAEEAVCMPSVQ